MLQGIKHPIGYSVVREICLLFCVCGSLNGEHALPLPNEMRLGTSLAWYERYSTETMHGKPIIFFACYGALHYTSLNNDKRLHSSASV